jgi:hypothetical protein
MPKRKIDEHDVSEGEHEMNASDDERGEGSTSWGTVSPGADDGGFEGVRAAPRRDQEGSEGGAIDEAVDLLATKAQSAIQRGLDKLDPEIVQWGQSVLSSFAVAAAPVRRSFKTQPLLTGAGVGAIAVGGVLLAVAISKDRGASHKPRARTRARDN